MTKFKVFLVFIFSVFIVCVSGGMNCENDSSQYCVVIRGIESLGNIAEKYQTRLDNRVPFPQLSNAIKQIDEQMGSYQGNAKNNMVVLRRLNNGLEDTYHQCVSPVYNWCISSSWTFTLYINYTTTENQNDHTKKVLIKMLTEKIIEGHIKINSSLSILKMVISDTTNIKNVLGLIHIDLKQDFSAEGYYGKKKHELESANGRRIKRELMLSFLGELQFIVQTAKTVLGLVNEVTGIALGLAKALFGAGISSRVVERNQDPNYSESIKIIETLYTVLDTKIREAQHYAEEAHIALLEDSDNLDALHRVLIGTSDTLPLFNTDLEVEIIKALKDVRSKCLTYIIWHTNPDHSNFNSRHRRDTGTINFLLQESNGQSIYGQNDKN